MQNLGSQRCCTLNNQGPVGLPGPQGIPGIGSRGDTGMTGISFTGPTGRSCKGPTGPIGIVSLNNIITTLNYNNTNSSTTPAIYQTAPIVNYNLSIEANKTLNDINILLLSKGCKAIIFISNSTIGTEPVTINLTNSNKIKFRSVGTSNIDLYNSGPNKIKRAILTLYNNDDGTQIVGDLSTYY